MKQRKLTIILFVICICISVFYLAYNDNWNYYYKFFPQSISGTRWVSSNYEVEFFKDNTYSDTITMMTLTIGKWVELDDGRIKMELNDTKNGNTLLKFAKIEADKLRIDDQLLGTTIYLEKAKGKETEGAKESSSINTESMPKSQQESSPSPAPEANPAPKLQPESSPSPAPEANPAPAPALGISVDR